MPRTSKTYKEFLLQYGGFLSLNDLLDPYYQWVGEAVEEVIVDTIKALPESVKSNDDFYITTYKDEFDYLYKYIRLYIFTSIASSIYHDMDRNKRDKNIRRYIMDAIMTLANKRYMEKECQYSNEKDLDIHEMYYCVEKFLETFGDGYIDNYECIDKTEKFEYFFQRNVISGYTYIDMRDAGYTEPRWQLSMTESVIDENERCFKISYSNNPAHLDELDVKFKRLDEGYSVEVLVNNKLLAKN